MAANIPNPTNRREYRYNRFFQIVDQVVQEIQDHRWADTGKPKRRLKGDHFQVLQMSVETLIRDSVPVVYQQKRKGEASIHLNGSWYSSPASPADLTYSIHVQRAYRGMLEMGYLEQTKKGVFDRQGRNDGSTRNRLTRYQATDRLMEKFTPDEREVLPVIVPPQKPHAPIRIRVQAEDGRREDFPAPESGEVLLMHWHLKRINRVLASRWYDLHIPDAELAVLQSRLADDPDGESLSRWTGGPSTVSLTTRASPPAAGSTVAGGKTCRRSTGDTCSSTASGWSRSTTPTSTP
ncbi:hypothetical protein [Limimaricola litoreus]|uniref:Uncharacterized protein n=1 Tax=Limimaricola litoreus TaxID=2955316 RepID=A0A9X2FWL6_9RHOB|nr:hypothetical protein [Limimaricola litoreus]MCP1168483.1 hypothetical protein [Limimaricola litoreus]